MADAPDLTVEILKQIRDGIFDLKAEVHGVKDEVASVKNEVASVKNEVACLREEMHTEMTGLRNTVARVARVNDETLSVSLHDSGRMDALEGRLRTLESEVAELRGRQP